MMQKYFEGLAVLVVATWVGGMWAVGYIVAPVLFHELPDKALAGRLAGSIFQVMAYVGIFSAIYLLAFEFIKSGKRVISQPAFWLLVVMLILTLVGQYGIQPLLAALKEQALPQYVMQSAFADRFRFWHGLASVIFLIQSIAGAALLLKFLIKKQMVKDFFVSKTRLEN